MVMDSIEERDSTFLQSDMYGKMIHYALANRVISIPKLRVPSQPDQAT